MVDPVNQLADTVRIEGARILATLVRTVGSLPVAEDAVQDAIVSALREWPRSGIPSEPRAWLTVVARRRAIDALRREASREAKERDSADLLDLATADLPTDASMRDDQLRLIFTCCHPALATEAQVALALRTLCGLSTTQIAAVLLTTESAMSKRLTRTRQKIVAAHIPYRIPAPAELPNRLTAVCGVIHALYTIGHAPISGAAVVNIDMCAEAIRLGRLVVDLLPDEPQPTAVLALLLLTDARRFARADDVGDVVPAIGSGPISLESRADRGGVRAARCLPTPHRRDRRSLPVAGSDCSRACTIIELRRHRLARDRPVV